MAELMVKDSLEIRAKPERVWQVLTDPELTQKYMFGCRTVSDWKVGSPLRWQATVDGQEVVAVKGTILEIEPGRLLRYTVIDAGAPSMDRPENYLRVTYQLTPQGDGVRLDVTQGDYAAVADGQKRYQDTLAGWPRVLAQIKALAEAG
jgi:uncharacterized protein YndB with AHSA1/START domain